MPSSLSYDLLSLSSCTHSWHFAYHPFWALCCEAPWFTTQGRLLFSLLRWIDYQLRKNWKDPLSHKKMLLWMDNFFNPSFFYVVNFLTPKDFFSSMLHNSAWITENTNTREHVVSPLWPEVGLVLVWTHPGKVRSAASLNLLYMAPKYHSGAM